jgi:hypothetical protein
MTTVIIDNINIDNMRTREIILPEGWDIDNISDGKIILKEKKSSLNAFNKCSTKVYGVFEFVELHFHVTMK